MIPRFMLINMGRNIWYTPDPEPDQAGNTDYLTVHYHDPYITEKEKETRARRAHKRQNEEEEIMADPVKRYRHEKKQEIRRRAERLRKDPAYNKMTEHQIYRHVADNYGNQNEPTILTKSKSEAERQKEKNAGRKPRTTTRREQAIERNAEAGNLVIKEFGRDFVDKIKATRTQRGVTQEELAKMVHRTKNEIRDLENGELKFDGGLKSQLIWKLGL
jgi:DNA-binding XRE family transcriptional regulator